MASIYEVTGELLALMDMAEQEDMDPQALADTLEGLTGEFDDKVESWVKCIKNLEGEAKAVKDEAKRLADRAKTIENNTKRMKETVLACLKALGKTEAGGLLKAKVQKNGGVAPLVFDEGVTPEQVPPIFRKVTVDFDNAAIRAALDEDQVIGFAHYGERGESLRIK